MDIKTLGEKSNPAILFFHAMGVTGESSLPVANFLKDNYFCIMPTSTVYCAYQNYISKQDELNQIYNFLNENNIQNIKLVVASSLGADLATEFLHQEKIPVEHVFFDGGQFAQIKKSLRTVMVPFLYLAIKSLYWSKGKTLKKILWCDDDSIKPYFIDAGKNLKYKNLKKQLADSLEDKPFPTLSEELQRHTFFEFGSIEEHMQYRDNLIKSYPYGNFPVFTGLNHMQYQIRDPQGFANVLISAIDNNQLPNLPFLQK